ncbi:multidrug efflux RND transporter permease subunit [uncultured Ilyobacter sp.]|uniref:efflux RND transporter permease subunit n=1 Tax=uncultured Ilyobacter sp. TaxID=544433 RepID=UPI0029C03956|nr:multidrug efflux RND transporter permease subunit [uncultured Ilyobacter sp.]
MFSKFFIKRPIFAGVISIVIVIAGLVTMKSLPVAQYPEIAPPTVQVSAVYPGANAETISLTVAQPIEGEVNGVENMIYMSSNSSNSGEYSLSVTFEVGTDMDVAQNLVQNRVSQALSSLPEEVQRQGVTTEKRSSNILLFASLTSENPMHDNLFLSNYATLNIKDELSRIKGVGGITVFGAGDYSMRIWLYPDKLKARGLTSTDVVNAVREQNIQVAAGQVGQEPSPVDQNFQFTVNMRGKLNSTEEFENIIVKTTNDGGMIRVRDIAKVELGSQSYNISNQLNGQPSAAIAVFLQPEANALKVAEGVKGKIDELSQKFPDGMKASIPFDTTTFVKSSIDEVIETLFISVILVFLTILLFLEDWRATLIPTVAIPVSLIGTFAVMAVLGVSINTLSLFGLVLAIGIVVDDAIIVVENAVRNIDENNLAPRDAAIKAMEEITGPVIATTLVLLSVFIPTAFLGGITGQLYRQFALTIATATIFSSINALTLSPALCAIFLRPKNPNKKHNIFTRAFNSAFGRTQKGYARILTSVVRRGAVMILAFIIMTLGVFWKYDSLPKGFVPKEDLGYAMINVQLPDAASLTRTKEVVDKITKRLEKVEGLENRIAISGYSIMDGAAASNNAAFWLVFKPWEERKKSGLSMDKIMGEVSKSISDIQEARILVFTPPPIRGLGNAGGFQMQVQDRASAGSANLEKAVQNIVMNANSQSKLTRVYSTYRANVPQLLTVLDRTQAKTLKIPLSNIFNTLQGNLGSTYVNDFNQFGRNYQVRAQASADYRATAEDIKKLEVRNEKGEMVPMGTVLSVEEAVGPQIITRYNMYPSASISGQGAGFTSSGEAMLIMEELANENLPSSMGFEWTGMSYQEKAAEGNIIFIFGLAVLFVYLVLCAQYESWTLPLTIVLTVPLAVLGTVTALSIRQMDVNVYTQLGIVLLIAMTCKTAILISEFAKEESNSGMSLVESALEASRLRFRPILMTAFTFILGVLPLTYATGAGAESRRSLGTATAGGMLSATLLLIFFVPVFYIIIMGASEKLKKRFKKSEKAEEDAV